MPLPQYKPTKQDFEHVAWREVVSNCVEKECQSYAREFFRLASEAGAAKDEAAEAVYALLGYVTHLWFARDSGDAAFAPIFGPVPSDNSALAPLTTEHLTVFGQVVAEIVDPELKARVADILWVRTRNPDVARTAVDAYLESAARLEHPKHWPPTVERLRRAASIAAMLGHGNEPFQRVMAHIEGVLDRHNSTDPLYLSLSCMEILLEHHHGDATKYAKLCEDIANRCSPIDTDRAERCWLLKAEWHRAAEQPELTREARVGAAEAHVKRAELHVSGEAPSYAHAVWCIQRAIGILRKTEGTRVRREELHKQLLDFQRKSLAEMKQVFGGKIDLSEAVARARSCVEGKPFAEAIRVLAMGIFGPRPLSKIRAEAEAMREEHQLLFLISTQYLDKEGRVSGVSGRRRGQPVDPKEAALLDRMLDNTRQFEHELHAQAYVEPARKQLLLEHSVGLFDWFTIATASPFVPPGRERLWAQALHSGFIGDFASMLHLVIPQIEHSLRHLLLQAGEPTSSLSDDGIQEERDLSWLLSHPKLDEILGPDYVFHLRCLLVERAGANLRNRVAHGLLGDMEVYGWVVRYLWWLAVRLCVHPIIALERQGSFIPSEEPRTPQADAPRSTAPPATSQDEEHVVPS